MDEHVQYISEYKNPHRFVLHNLATVATKIDIFIISSDRILRIEKYIKGKSLLEYRSILDHFSF